MDKLVGQNPRDSLILLRREIREEMLAERNNAKRKQALFSYNMGLDHFAEKFFKKDNVLNRLSDAQKQELAKLCSSFCKKRVAIITSPYAAVLAWIMFSGINYHWSLFVMLVPWLFLTGLGFFLWSRWGEYVEFLWAKNVIEKLGKEVKPGGEE